MLTLAFTLCSDAAVAGEINSCKFLIVQDFTNDPVGIAAELRAQATGQGFMVVSSVANVQMNDLSRLCVMAGSWYAGGGHGFITMRVNDGSGALVAEASVSVTARLSVSRTVRFAVSKIYSQLAYTGFDEHVYLRRMEREYPSRPTMAITEEIIKNSDPKVWRESGLTLKTVTA